MRISTSVGSIAALAFALCCGTAPAQVATWITTNASGTNFNDSLNWSGTPTFSTTGTFTFVGGTSAVMPVLTQSATIRRLSTSGTPAGTITLASSSTDNVLTAGSNFNWSTAGSVGLTINAKVGLLGSGTFSAGGGPLTLGQPISGGSATDTLAFDSGSRFSGMEVYLSATNSFSAVPVLQRNKIVCNVAVGNAGQIGALGASGTIRAGSAGNYTLLTLNAANDTIDRRWEILNANGADVRVDGTAVTLTGTIAHMGTGASSFGVWSNNTVVAGPIIETTTGTLAFQMGGGGLVTLTNTASSFRGRVYIDVGTLSTPMLGRIGSPSPLGAGDKIWLGGGGGVVLRYTGAGENSDKIMRFVSGQSIEASGSGLLRLSNPTVEFDGTGNRSITLRGSGAGQWDANLFNNTGGITSITKSNTGSWTLTGTNTNTGAFSLQRGTLTFANRASLYNGGTASWTQANISTTYNTLGDQLNQTLGLGVGGAAGFTNEDVTLLITNLGGNVASGGMRRSASWGFDTTNTGSTFTVGDVIADTTGGSGNTQGGTIGVAKLGSGTLALSGTNTYTFGTRIDGGVLTITNTAALGAGTGFLNFNGGTLDLAGLTLTRPGGMTATAGGLTNGVISGTGSLVKTGGGTFRITTGSNTFSGSTSIQEGVVEAVALAASGVASSLGTGTGANATINVGNAATSGTFRYIGDTSGTMSRTLNLSGSTGNGGIEASGSGALVVTSAVTAANGSKTLTLGGTGTAANAIGVIGEPGTGDLSVVKDGPGLWRLTGVSTFEGGLTVRDGTVVATVNSGAGTDAGVFGKADNLTVGNSAVGATGTASLLLAPGVIADRVLKVPSTTGGQAVVLGGEAAGTTSEFRNAVWLGRAVTLVAATSGTTIFGNTWAAESGSGTTAANVTIGAAGNLGTVRLGNNLTTTGSVGVRFGTLDVAVDRTLTAAGIVGIDGGATLAGVGTVAATLGGAGFVAPGNSPGILTANAVDPTAGLDFNFEFTGAAPAYGIATSSTNDVLRLTGGTAFTTLLSSSNAINVYLDVGSLALNDTFRGGFFTDQPGSFASSIADATYTYWVSGTGAGQTTYLSKTYVPFSSVYSSLAMQATTVSDTAEFSVGSPTSGQVMQFTVVVPEPGTLALAALGLGLAGYALRRRLL